MLKHPHFESNTFDVEVVAGEMGKTVNITMSDIGCDANGNCISNGGAAMCFIGNENNITRFLAIFVLLFYFVGRV